MKLKTVISIVSILLIIGTVIGCSNDKEAIESGEFRKVEEKIRSNIGVKTSLQTYNTKVDWTSIGFDEQNKMINKIIGDIEVVDKTNSVPEKYIIAEYDNMNIYFLLESKDSGENIVIETNKKYYLGKLEEVEIDKIREYIISQGLIEK